MKSTHAIKLFVASLLSVLLLVSCGVEQGPSEQVIDLSKEQQLWNFLVIDEGGNSKIRKWLSLSTNTILIVDQEHMAQFAPQILDLMDKFNDQSPIHVNLCFKAVHSDSILSSKGNSCASDPSDSYFIVTNGQWDEKRWNAAVEHLPAWASSRFRRLMKRIDDNAALGKGTCQFVLRPSTETAYDIAGAIAVADFSDKKLIGACFINLFLGSLGVSPFDGHGQIDVRAEAKSYADFLLKETPNGALYLTKILYSADLRPGMSESEAAPVLRSLLSERH